MGRRRHGLGDGTPRTRRPRVSGDSSAGRGPVVIVKTGSTFAPLKAQRGDFDAWIASGLELPESMPIEVVAIYEGEPLPALDEIAGVVITGSPSMVSDREPWSEAGIGWLEGVLDVEVPCLGICYGHQMLARAAGAAVGPNALGREIGTRQVSMHGHGDDPLLSVLPDGAWVHTTHVESVLESPSGATIRGTTTLDPHHVFALGETAWGVQFHPEFDDEIMRFYIAERRDPIRADRLDPDALFEAVRPTPWGRALLRRFGELVLSASG